MQSEDDSLWESFPQALKTLEVVRRYISAFRAPLQELNNLNPHQVHALQACLVLWRGHLLQEASQRTSQSLTCWVGLPWSKTWWQTCRRYHPIWSMMWAFQQWSCSSYWKPPPEWASATFAAIWAPDASAWEPTSRLPLRHGAR